MANKDTEIEIKIPLDETLFSQIKTKLKEIASFKGRSKQIDEYYTPTHRNFVEPAYPFEWLSIRNRNGKVILNYKHFHPENVEVTTHCDEFEVYIKNLEQLQKTFSALNFKKLITVNKEREIYNYNDEFEIGLDKVKELGNFIEIETIKDFGDIETARNKLFEFAKTLGVDTGKTDVRGYPYLLMEKKGLINK